MAKTSICSSKVHLREASSSNTGRIAFITPFGSECGVWSYSSPRKIRICSLKSSQMFAVANTFLEGFPKTAIHWRTPLMIWIWICRRLKWQNFRSYLWSNVNLRTFYFVFINSPYGFDHLIQIGFISNNCLAIIVFEVNNHI